MNKSPRPPRRCADWAAVLWAEVRLAGDADGDW